MSTAAVLKTLIPAAIVLAITLPKGGAFVLALLVPLFAIWLLYNAVRMVMKPAERKGRGIRIAVWLAVFVLAGGVQAYWERAGRDAADGAVAAVVAHRARTGSYPASLTEAGVSEALRQRWGIVYRLNEGKPQLDYVAPLLPMSTYEYDFDQRTWKANVY